MISYILLDTFLGSKEFLGGILPIPGKGDGLWVGSLEMPQQGFGVCREGGCRDRFGFL